MPYEYNFEGDKTLKDKATSVYVDSMSAIIATKVVQSLDIASAAGGPIGLLFNTLSGMYQYEVAIKQQGGGYEAIIPATGQVIADASLKTVVAGVLYAGAAAVGFTAGTTLVVSAMIGSSILFTFMNDDDVNLWRSTVTEVIDRWVHDDTAGMFDQEAKEILEYFDNLFGAPGDPTPISDLIADAADLFGRAFTSPIALDLNANGLELSAVEDGVYFDIDGDGFAEKTGWVKPADAFLARDLNGNGVIDSQKEMFGTDAASSAVAKLAGLDGNHCMIPAWQVAMMNIHLPAIALSVNEG